MCGFVGIYEHAVGQGSVSHELISRMSETVRHRGPDGEGVFVSGDRRIGLGHRRLAIVDVEHGGQPMFGRHGEVLVFNGEIYNYPSLRAELDAAGERFATACDTEVILHLYAREEIDCLHRLDGMFAFALWDPRREQLLLARDRIGEKPLYWTTTGGRLLFASEIKALLEHPAVQPDVDRNALNPYLANLVVPSPATLYRGISKLAPGTMGICDRSGLRISRYWNLSVPRVLARPAARDAARTVREMLAKSVKSRLMSDVAVGVLLSGGLDSTTLLALLHEQAVNIPTFSVGFDDSEAIDERAQARRAAGHFGTEHHEIVVSEDDAVSFLPRLVHHQDEPLADPVCLPLNFVCQLAHDRGVKVVLAGEGADELFWGYPRYRQILAHWRWIRAFLRMPRPLRALPARLFPASSHAHAHDLLQSLASGRPSPLHFPLGLARHQRELLLAGAATTSGVGWAPMDAGQNDPLTTLLFDTQEYEFGVRLPELLLMRIDRFSMANGIEARVPFLDPELVEFVYRLPLEHKLEKGMTKVIMREAVADLVPAWVLERRKQGFGAPIVEWLGAHLGTVFRRLLHEDAIRAYFDADAIARMLRSDQPASVRFSLWPILNFALWHIAWIERRPLDELLATQPARAAARAFV